jgi:hypothetical protein
VGARTSGLEVSDCEFEGYAAENDLVKPTVYDIGSYAQRPSTLTHQH